MIVLCGTVLINIMQHLYVCLSRIISFGPESSYNVPYQLEYSTGSCYAYLSSILGPVGIQRSWGTQVILLEGQGGKPPYGCGSRTPILAFTCTRQYVCERIPLKRYQQGCRVWKVQHRSLVVKQNLQNSSQGRHLPNLLGRVSAKPTPPLLHPPNLVLV